MARLSVSVLYVGVCIYCASVLVVSAPILETVAALEEAPPALAFDFMKQFGYLQKGIPNSEALHTKATIVEAIKNVQKFGAIPQTGMVDNATLKLMTAKRCGVPDIIRQNTTRRKRFVIGSSGWKKRDITYFIANWSPKVGEQVVREEIQRAFDAWGGYARLRFRAVWDNNADIVIVFGRGPHGDWYPFDGPGNVLAHAFFPYEMGHLGGDVHFDEDENWKLKPGYNEDGTDFYSVAVHEIGHSLGLAHSPVHDSIMFPYYKGYQPSVQIGYDDILAMYELYISRVLEEDNLPRVPTVDESGSDEGVGRVTTEPSSPTRPVTTTSAPSTTTTTTTTRPGVTFDGDVESVDDHKTHDPRHGIPPSPSAPQICEGSFDAVGLLRGDLFVFKNEFMWRLSDRQVVMPGYPAPFRQMFSQLPESIKKIDAAYQRTTDESIVLFTGKTYWVYDGRNFIEGSPRPLTDYGLPDYLSKIDAVQVWKKNGKLFLYSEDRYWRYNETTRAMDANYPQSIARWRGVPPHLDAAVTWRDGFTYFFKGPLFWRFDNKNIITHEHYPLPAAQHWLGCPERPDTIWW